MKEKESNKSVISWIFEFAKSKKWEYMLSVSFALLGVASSLMPYIVMIDIVKALVGGAADKTWVLSRCIVMGVWWIIRYIFHSLSTGLSHHATFNVLANMRKALMQKLSTLPLGTILRKSSGSYKSVIVERVDSIETTLAHLLPEMTSNIIGGLAVLVMIFCINWKMGLAMFVVVPLGIICFLTMYNGYEEKFKRSVDSTKALNDTAVEYINGIEVIKTFGQAKTSYEKFVSAAKEGADCFIEWMRGSLFGMAGGMAIFPSTLIGIIPVGCVMYIHGTLSAEQFISIVILSFGAIQPLITAFSYSDDIAQVKTIIGEVSEIFEQKDLVRADISKAEPKNNDIELKDVHFSYKDTEILHGINMHIKEGTVNALVGPSGSGKSTIARLIASLWDVDSGSITLGGAELKDLSLEDCTQNISYVSQDNYLFDMTVMENIRIGKSGASDEDVVNAAKACGCHDFIMSLENGYQTVCGSSGGHLSGGERQRISIARAMLKNAPIIILDEATSYTDPESEAVIQSALATLLRGKTVLIIAHRLSTISDADCIFVVNDGNIIANGTQEELLAKCELYKNMWEAHISVKDEYKEVQ